MTSKDEAENVPAMPGDAVAADSVTRVGPSAADKRTDERDAGVSFAAMKKHFDSQKKVSVKVAEQQFVQVNGYTFIIEPGQRVEVPEDVARMLEDAGVI